MAIFERLFSPKVAWPSGPQRAAYLAALGLIAIQVGIGIIMKAAQHDGAYSFSASGSIAISECLKMLLSTIFFCYECKRRALNGTAPSIRGSNPAYESLRSEDDVSIDEESEELKEYSPSSTSSRGDDEESGPADRQLAPLPFNLRVFWAYIRGEVTDDVRFGFYNLALFYILINNSIFLSYKMADPGTIQLTKSGVTLITALVMIVTLNQRLSKIQWMAIAIQICGLVVTQYQPGTGSIYPIETYALLLFQVFLSAVSGVYNQALLKADESSLHADNMALYGAGAVVNLLCHLLIKIVKPGEPGFFEGYGSLGALLVIASNVFIGLAITAVYRYADAIIKCFATAFATAILLYVSPLLFHTPLSLMVAPGTFIIFIASWLYMEGAPPKPTDSEPAEESEKEGIFAKLSAVAKRYPYPFLSLTTAITVGTVLALAMYEVTMPDQAKIATTPNGIASGPLGEEVVVPETVASPFQNSIGFIRWNAGYPERIPLLMKYKPFFRDIHLSMPHLLDEMTKTGLSTRDDDDYDPYFHNLTHSQWGSGEMIYEQLARTMQLILDTEPEIDGLLYWHFDAWVDPLAWSSKDFANIHFPLTSPPHEPGWPAYQCMNETETSRSKDWFGFDDNNRFHIKAQQATRQLAELGLGFTIEDEKEFCLAWTDIYWVPRRFFKDYILLSSIFFSYRVFHEVAVPTMLHIIDNSHRKNRYAPAMELFHDCWGHCCAGMPTIEDVLTYRCGHRLEYRDPNVTLAFYQKLDDEAMILGLPVNHTHVRNLTEAFPTVEKEETTTSLPVALPTLEEKVDTTTSLPQASPTVAEAGKDTTVAEAAKDATVAEAAKDTTVAGTGKDTPDSPHIEEHAPVA